MFQFGDIFGFLAGAFMLSTAFMPRIVHLRVCLVLASLCFVAYGLWFALWPVLILHAILLPLNLFRLGQTDGVPGVRPLSASGPSLSTAANSLPRPRSAPGPRPRSSSAALLRGPRTQRRCGYNGPREYSQELWRPLR